MVVGIAGWLLLVFSLFGARAFYFLSAKWVKLAWHKEADLFGKIKLSGIKGLKHIENLLDWSYTVMILGFMFGLFCMIAFMLTAQVNRFTIYQCYYKLHAKYK